MEPGLHVGVDVGCHVDRVVPKASQMRRVFPSHEARSPLDYPDENEYPACMDNAALNVAAVRKKHKLSQTKLAEIAHVSQATVSRIEAGEASPSLQFLSNLAKHLGLPLKELVPEPQLQALLGQDERQMFYAFCPNPLCDRNTYFRKDGQDWVKWTSGKMYAVEAFDEVNYCTRCGTNLVKECPSCGRRLEEGGAGYCITCGKEIVDRPTLDEWKSIRSRLDSKEGGDSDEEVPF